MYQGFGFGALAGSFIGAPRWIQPHGDRPIMPSVNVNSLQRKEQEEEYRSVA